ncbi:transmembrane and coiled-coil domain-containing protein 5A isoform X3 [Sminthopsis crassicaudata]|uniref:transmembrane and coiled-coil domain-containing protein 5A isoform X3 n=1 Tax=Sminthopsis crassicaudata TaxID=9301 RepID=UPI003D68CA28
MEEEEEQTLLDNESSQKMEILRLEQSKKTLNSLNMDLEKDLQRIDEANQSLLLKIQKEEDENNRLENELARLAHLAEEQERKELECTLTDKEQDLKELEQETAKLEKINEALTQGIAALQNQLSGKTHAPKVLVPEEENLSESPEVAKMKIQQAEVSLAEQEKELAKVLDEYESVQRLCEAQAYCIKKYQEALRKMEEEVENRFLEREVAFLNCSLLFLALHHRRRSLLEERETSSGTRPLDISSLQFYCSPGYKATCFFILIM